MPGNDRSQVWHFRRCVAARRWRPLLALLATALACHGCATRQGRGTSAAGHAPRRLKIAVLPAENLSGTPVPLEQVDRGIQQALRSLPLEIASPQLVESLLARHRIRYTGGLNRTGAKALASEMDVNAVLVTSLLAFDQQRPTLAVSMRLVATDGGVPRILWVDGEQATGDGAPGLLGLGIVRDAATLQRKVLARLVDSLAAHLAGGGRRSRGCSSTRRFAPTSTFVAPWFDGRAKRVVTVLPFRNLSGQPGAGMAVMVEFVRQLLALDQVEVLDPGLVRDLLLDYRLIMQDGVDVETARLIAGVADTDAVIGGSVFEYDGTSTAPRVNFSALMLEGRTGRVGWRFRSAHRGDDGVYLFELGRANTAAELGCRMVGTFVASIGDKRPSPGGSP